MGIGTFSLRSFFFLGGKGQVRDATSRFACVSQILNLIFFKQMFGMLRKSLLTVADFSPESL